MKALTHSELVRKIRECTDCFLCQDRTQAVPGSGLLEAELMFIGEAPGFHEDRNGLPFVGPAGKILDELLASVGLKRSDIYITNVVKCRPPSNRDPYPAEVAACKPYLDAQIRMVNPRVIITLGRFALENFFPGAKISKAKGIVREWNGRTVYPVYHPAAALHNPSLKERLFEDFSRLPKVVSDARQSELKVIEEEEAGPKMEAMF